MNFWEFETMLLASNHNCYGGEEYEEATYGVVEEKQISTYFVHY